MSSYRVTCMLFFSLNCCSFYYLGPPNNKNTEKKNNRYFTIVAGFLSIYPKRQQRLYMSHSLSFLYCFLLNKSLASVVRPVLLSLSLILSSPLQLPLFDLVSLTLRLTHSGVRVSYKRIIFVPVICNWQIFDLIVFVVAYFPSLF